MWDRVGAVDSGSNVGVVVRPAYRSLAADLLVELRWVEGGSWDVPWGCSAGQRDRAVQLGDQPPTLYLIGTGGVCTSRGY